VNPEVIKDLDCRFNLFTSFNSPSHPIIKECLHISAFLDV